MPNLLDAYGQHLRIERRRGALTVARYKRIAGEFAKHLASNPDTARLGAHALTRLHCLDYLRTPRRAAAEPSRSVWNQRLAALRSLFRYLLDRELVAKDPTHGIERHRIPTREVVPLTLDEFLDLLEASERTGPRFRGRNAAILQVLFNTALRVRELISLDVAQLDWNAHVLRDVPTKGAKWLSAKFNDPVGASLVRYLPDRAERHPGAGGALFLSSRGTRLSVRAVEALVSSLGKAAGIGRPVTPHLFRHSCATELVELGAGLRVVQQICGHASQATTEHYVHARRGADREAIDALGDAVMRAIRIREARAVAA